MTTIYANETVFKAIADPTRRAILEFLVQGEMAVLALVERFRMSQPAISQHLKVLKDANLVEIRRLGRQRLYSLNAAPLKAVYDWAGHYQAFWEEKLDALGQFLEELD